MVNYPRLRCRCVAHYELGLGTNLGLLRGWGRAEKGETDRFSLLVYRQSTNQYIEAVIVIEEESVP